ncbi:MAG: PspC domain protein [Syntrophaceae bacterium PtaB.Bin038]|jgi:phage shock protein PspC (stress-responsive transcriptional regulator)|nr:MAG: PspC domain protein [Syntrophaceae bacterium PtaB.Bin038]
MEEKNVLQTFKRSRTDRWLGGICGALGARTPVPSWAWRLLFVLLFLAYGTGFLLYVLLWIFVPQEPEAQAG